MTPLISSALLGTQSDDRLLALAQGGHERAFEAIVQRYRMPLRRYVRRLLPEPRAEDVVQQAFLNAWSALAGGAAVRDLRPWLYRVARNAALDAIRASGYDLDELSESVSSLGSTEDDVERRAVIRETLAGLAALPPSQREALLRTAVEGDSRADIARDLGVTEGAVRQLVHRARTTLRAAATAVTPLPVAAWAAAAGAPAVEATGRIAEIAAGAGSAGAGALAAKTAAVIVATGALATGSVQLAQSGSGPESAGASTATGQATESGPAERAASRSVGSGVSALSQDDAPGSSGGKSRGSRRDDDQAGDGRRRGPGNGESGSDERGGDDRAGAGEDQPRSGRRDGEDRSGRSGPSGDGERRTSGGGPGDDRGSGPSDGAEPRSGSGSGSGGPETGSGSGSRGSDSGESDSSGSGADSGGSGSGSSGGRSGDDGGAASSGTSAPRSDGD